MSNQRIRSVVGLIGWAFALGVCGYVVWSTFFANGQGLGVAGTSGDSGADSVLGAAAANRSAAAPPVTTALDQSGSRPPLIDDQERRYLWDIEQHGNRLGQKGLPRLASALKALDADALRAILADDFGGGVLAQPQEETLNEEFAQITRRRNAGHPATEVDRDQFIDELLNYRDTFVPPPVAGDVAAPPAPEVKLSLMALKPTIRGDLDSIWQGTCQLRMWGESAQGGPAEVVLYLNYQVRRPTAEILEAPGWLLSCEITQSQVARSPQYLMREVAAERGIDTKPFHNNWRLNDDASEAEKKAAQATPIGGRQSTPGGVYLCDYNRDGYLDVLITETIGLTFYEGLPDGKFKDVTLKVGLLADHPRQIVAGFIDIDGDGWEDLLLGNTIYRNQDGRKFVDYTNSSSLRFTDMAGGLIVGDYDCDGRMDVYVTVAGRGKADSWIEGKNGQPQSNELWRNTGNWEFENVTASTGTDGGNRSVFTAAWLDANDDGWPDLHVINEFGNGVLLVNQGNHLFKEEMLIDGPGDFGSMGLTVGDVNNDGRIDLYTGNMYSKAGSRVIANLKPDAYPPNIMNIIKRYTIGSQLWINQGDLKFQPVAQDYQVADIGWSYGPQLADLDNDGWLDLHATCGFMSLTRRKPDG